VRRRGGPPPGPPFLREERARGRGRLLILGAAIVAVVALIVLLTAGGGSSNKSASTSTSPSTLSSASGENTHTGTHHSETSLPASNPSETHVVVLNGTETGGLAHRLSGNLQQSGYTLATALGGHPSGYSTTVVEYASGHRTDARHVAQTLGVSQTKPLESAIAAMAGGSATVVVIAGSDLASTGTGSSAGTGSSTETGSGTGTSGTGAAESAGGAGAAGSEASGTPGEAAGGTGH
jgi:ABC-type Fe3+-hydroxamate transport system substrate-binding protein